MKIDMHFKFLLCLIFLWPSLTFASSPAKDALIRDAEIEDVLKYLGNCYVLSRISGKSINGFCGEANKVTRMKNLKGFLKGFWCGRDDHGF